MLMKISYIIVAVLAIGDLYEGFSTTPFTFTSFSFIIFFAAINLLVYSFVFIGGAFVLSYLWGEYRKKR